MQFLTNILICSSVASAAPALVGRAHHVHQHARDVSAASTGLTRMSAAQVNAIYKTCWNGQLVWPLGNTPAPCADVVTPQLSIYKKPEATANTLTVHNYCGYDIHFDHVKGFTTLESGVLAAGATIQRPLTGTVLKARKTKDSNKDMLVEYNVAADGQLWYNLSLITCLGTTNGLPNADTSGCAGHEAGLQLGNPGSKTFQCKAGAWCDDQAYLYQVSTLLFQTMFILCPGWWQ